ncbi:MAG: hypothetical protein U5Q03_05175 [Bacteroidota bacterium]|nr:hypothetical protein [Bacteroidota bacterium]
MKAKYLCPFCKAVLNVKGNVILAARNLKDIDNKGIVFLHEEIGNFSSHKSDSLEVEPGDVVNLYCPVCQENLDIEKGEGLAGITHVDHEGRKSTIVISRIYGEKSSFQVHADRNITSYGDKLSRFIDPEWFILYP